MQVGTGNDGPIKQGNAVGGYSATFQEGWFNKAESDQINASVSQHGPDEHRQGRQVAQFASGYPPRGQRKPQLVARLTACARDLTWSLR